MYHFAHVFVVLALNNRRKSSARPGSRGRICQTSCAVGSAAIWARVYEQEARYSAGTAVYVLFCSIFRSFCAKQQAEVVGKAGIPRQNFPNGLCGLVLSQFWRKYPNRRLAIQLERPSMYYFAPFSAAVFALNNRRKSSARPEFRGRICQTGCAVGAAAIWARVPVYEQEARYSRNRGSPSMLTQHKD